MQPNFNECWWDQWLLDFGFANALGIFIGLKIGNYLELKTYEWRGVDSIPDICGKVERVMMQFTPNSWKRVRWEATKSWRGFLAINALIIMFTICDLNIFFLKHLLWMPPPCLLNHYRLLICYLCGVPAVRQFYNYLTDSSCKRLGTQAFLVACIFFTEILVIIKFSPGEFPNAIPTQRAYFVAAAVVLHCVLATLYFLYMRRKANYEIAKLDSEDEANEQGQEQAVSKKDD
jgi:phosphatidylserine synthase 2